MDTDRFWQIVRGARAVMDYTSPASADEALVNVLQAQDLEAAQGRWRVREDELLADRVGAIRAALDVGAGAEHRASALAIGRDWFYAMATQGHRH